MKYQVYTLDVWGNETDGYEVNDAFKQGIISPRDTSDAALLDAIDELVGLTGREHARVDDFGGFIEITDSTTGIPVFHLYETDEEESK